MRILFSTLAATVATVVARPVYARNFTTVHAHRLSRTSVRAQPALLHNMPRRGFSSSYPEHIVLTMPALSPTMERGNIAAWKKKVGDHVKPGEALADIETDKATVAFESVEEGYIAKILIPEKSQDIPVGKPVAILAESKDSIDKFKDYAADGGAPAAATPAAASTPAASQPAAPAAAAATPAASTAAPSGGRVIASPAAKRVAGEQGVPLANVQGTGPGNRIVQADVLEQAAALKAAPAAARTAAPSPIAAGADGAYADIPHSNMRRVIASRLSLSKQSIPHYYLSVDIQMDAILKLRTELNALQDSADAKLSVNDFIIKASALACKKVPAVNSSWMDNAIRQYAYVDVSVAVSTDSGLVTPIVKDADTKGLRAIGADVKALAAKARAGKLQPAEYQGGTFTISNLGMFGVKNFSAIINPPQAAILAVGSTESRIIPAEKGANQPYTQAQVMSVTLSCDHRVVDGAVGAEWLKAFKGYLEKPNTMLL